MFRSIQLILGSVVIFSIYSVRYFWLWGQQVNCCICVTRHFLTLGQQVCCCIVFDFIDQYDLLSLLSTGFLSACALHFTSVLNPP